MLYFVCDVCGKPEPIQGDPPDHRWCQDCEEIFRMVMAEARERFFADRAGSNAEPPRAMRDLFDEPLDEVSGDGDEKIE